MSRKLAKRVAGLGAAACLGVALGKLIGALAPAGHPTAAIGPLNDTVRAPSIETIIAPSDSAYELLAATATPPPKAAPRPQRRAPVRYATRDADDGE